MSEQALEIWEELEKAISLVTTARRMMSTGARVDLSALEGKIRFVCSAAEGLHNEEGKTMLPVMEALIDDLDHLANSVRGHQGQLAERLTILNGSPVSNGNNGSH